MNTTQHGDSMSKVRKTWNYFDNFYSPIYNDVIVASKLQIGERMLCLSLEPSHLDRSNEGLQCLFLAWLFSKETSRYCHSPGVIGGDVGGGGVGGGGGSMQKL